MIIYFIKFIHLICTLALLGLTGFCLVQRSASNTTLNKIILLFVVSVVITGSLLVYPKHFTFHTPWIKAAYVFVSIFAASIFSLIYLKNKLSARLIYLLLVVLLVLVTHDAVTKTTLLFH